MKSLLRATLALAVFTMPALAHSPLKQSVPADGAVLETAPDTLDLTFGSPARLVKVVLIHKVGDMTAEKKVAIPTRSPVTDIQLEPEFDGPGEYSVQWRALGDDGHVIKGDFSFEVTGN